MVASKRADETGSTTTSKGLVGLNTNTLTPLNQEDRYDNKVEMIGLAGDERQARRNFQ